MKIIISSPNMFWDVNMNCMKNIKNDIILLQFEQAQQPDDVFSIDVSVHVHGLGQEPRNNRGGRQYIEVKRHLMKILRHIKEGEDVLVLADVNPQSVIIFDVLRTMTDGKNFKLHFWGIIPFRFDSIHRKTTYLELLNGSGRIKSLYIKNADDILKNVARRTTLSQVFEIMRDSLESEFITVLDSIGTFKKELTYFYDNQSKKYVDAKNFLVEKKEEDAINDLYTTMGDQLGEHGLLNEEKTLIEQPVVRSNGKVICQKLRQLRVEFAKANDIPFISNDCSYDGACAGTCAKCDSELEYLYKMLGNHLEKEPIYPILELEKELKNLISVTSGGIMGQLIVRKGAQNKAQEFQIPEFLKKHNE